MKIQKPLTFIIYTGTGFTAVHALLFIVALMNPSVYSNLSFHYSDSLSWYFIFFLLPLPAGLSLYLWLKDKTVHGAVKLLFGILLIFQISFTITASVLNDRYWGYAFRRPVVFSEIHKAERVVSCTGVSNTVTDADAKLRMINDTTWSPDNLYGRKDLYYGTTDRIFMVFQDNAHISASLFGLPEIYRDKNMKISSDLLSQIDRQIAESGFIDRREQPNNKPLPLSGQITEFMDGDGQRYLFAGLRGGEVSNDHYPTYEFLFGESGGQYRICKKQKFFTDTAGIEGFEYANIAPFFSLLITLTGLLGLSLIVALRRILRMRSRQ